MAVTQTKFRMIESDLTKTYTVHSKFTFTLVLACNLPCKKRVRKALLEIGTSIIIEEAVVGVS